MLLEIGKTIFFILKEYLVVVPVFVFDNWFGWDIHLDLFQYCFTHHLHLDFFMYIVFFPHISFMFSKVRMIDKAALGKKKEWIR